MYRKTRKLFAVCLVVSMLLTMTVFSTIASAATSKRLEGADRYATALSIVKDGWTSSEYAVLATGEDYADALAAAPLAKAYNAPILLVDPATDNAALKAELTALGVKTVFIVGGEGVVSKEFADGLTAYTVVRLGGLNRVETSVKVAAQLVAKVGTISEIAVANEDSYADALSMAAIAANKNMPILLTSKDSLPTEVSAFLTGKTIIKSYVLGETGVVSDAVKAVLPNAVRLGGADRYATNLAILSNFADLNYANVVLTAGENYPDALAGSAYAAKLYAPVVLVNETITADTLAFVESKLSADSKVIALGGVAVCPQAEVDRLVNYANALEFKVAGVTANNLKEVTIVFTQNVNMAASGETDFTSSALNPANYSPAGTLKKVDARTVVLTLTTTPTKGAAVSVTVANVKNAALTKQVPYYATAYVAADSVAPTATASVDVNKVLTLTFSEPMASTGNVYVGGTSTGLTLSTDAKKATATLGASYEAGKSYSVVIVGAYDLAGNYIAPNPTSLSVTMVNDTVKPVAVSVTPTANATKLNVKFTEALMDQGATDYATLTFKDPAGNVVGDPVLDPVYASAVVADTDSLVYEATINLLSTYTYRYLDVTVSSYKDLAGVAGDNLTVRVLLQQDKVAPAYSSVKAASDSKSIIVNFDEALAVGSGATNGVTVSYTNNDGIVYADEILSVAGPFVNKDGGTTSTLSALNVVPISWKNTDGTLKVGTYTITVKANAVEDAYGNENSNAITVPVVVGTPTAGADTTAPVLSDAAFVAGSIRVIEIASDSDLAAPVLSNVKLDGAAMPAGTKVYLYNSKKTVRVELPVDSITLDGVRVISVTLSDLAGNAATETEALDFDENVRPYVKTVVLSDPQSIVITVSENVTGVSPAIDNDFVVYVNGVEKTLASVGVNGTKVTLTLNAAVALADTLTVKVAGSDIVDANVNSLVSGGTFTVTR